MSTIKSSDEHLTLNADGSSKDIKFQANGVEKASISSAGAFTSTTIDATKLTGTIPNFTSTGIDDNADATAITIDSSENVGIGTTSPTENLHIKEAGSSNDGMVPLIKVQTTTNNATGDGSAIAFHGDYNSTEWGFGKIGGANSGANYGGALEFHTNAGNGSSASIAYTKQFTITHDGRGLSQFTAQSWVRVNMNGGHSTVDSHNISSISDGGTGICTVNIATDPANSNFGVVAAPHDTSNGSESVSSIGTGTFTVKVSLVISSGVSFYDRGFTAVVFGD